MKYALVNAMLLDGSENMKAHRAAVLGVIIFDIRKCRKRPHCGDSG